MRRLTFATAVLAVSLGLYSRPASASDWPYVAYGNGPMKNLTVDLVFWGFGNTINNGGAGPIDPRVKPFMDALQDIANWVNTGWIYDDEQAHSAPIPGWEAAIHAYGLSGITPGLWVNNPLPIPDAYLPSHGTSHLGDAQIIPVVQGAHNGNLGAARDLENNVVNTSGLPASSNRLTLVVTNNSNNFLDGTAAGYHSWGTFLSNQPGLPVPYGGIQVNAATSNLAHEIFEAMSDAHPFSGWNTLSTGEIADGCPGKDQLPVRGSSWSNWFSWVTMFTAYRVPTAPGTPASRVPTDPNTPPSFLFEPSGTFSAAAGRCLQFIPEQHAPLDATFEYGFQSQPLDLVYIDTAGHVQEMEWDSAGGTASGPFDLGPPSPTVAAAGKPSIVWSSQSGERIFVKGSDNALWMHWRPNGGNGSWMSLGGVIYGDPKAVLWDNNQLLDVFVLGTDDNIYFYGMGPPNTFWGWSPLVWPGRLFVSSPTVISTSAQTLDLFANGEDGQLWWMALRPSTGWQAPVVAIADNPTTFYPMPMLGTPTVAVDSQNNTMEIFSTYQLGNVAQSYSSQGGAWAPENAISTGNGSTLQGSIASVSSTPGHFDAFGVSRSGDLWWWYTNNPTNPNAWTNGNGASPLEGVAGPLMATGDPVAISRQANEVEVFYRTTNGQLAHLTGQGSAWSSEYLLPQNSIR